jgi:hypothetical protein
MINVLDLLKYRLGQNGQPAMPSQRQQLSGLPEAVQRSLLGQPTYGEGELMPLRWPMATDAQREFDTHDPNAPAARSDQLESQLWQNRIFPQYDVPLAEGETRLDIGPPRATYPSPLNQLMRRGPFALY